MGRNDIQNNKYKVLFSPIDEKKNSKPRKKTLVQRIIQWRLIGYIVILVGLLKIHNDIEYTILQMFLLIVFTELQSRGVSKNKLDTLKEELQLQQDIHYEDRKEIKRKGQEAQAKKDALKVKKDIEDNYLDSQSHSNELD